MNHKPIYHRADRVFFEPLDLPDLDVDFDLPGLAPYSAGGLGTVYRKRTLLQFGNSKKMWETLPDELKYGRRHALRPVLRLPGGKATAPNKLKTYDVPGAAPSPYTREYWDFAPSEVGYLTVDLYIDGKSHRRKVAELVWEAFGPHKQSEGSDLVVYHLNLDVTNCRYNNLRLGTKAQAKRWKAEMQALRLLPAFDKLPRVYTTTPIAPAWMPRGVSPKAAISMKLLLAYKMPQRAIARAFDITRHDVAKIVRDLDNGTLLTRDKAEKLAETVDYVACMMQTRELDKADGIPATKYAPSIETLRQVTGFGYPKLQRLLRCVLKEEARLSAADAEKRTTPAHTVALAVDRVDVANRWRNAVEHWEAHGDPSGVHEAKKAKAAKAAKAAAERADLERELAEVMADLEEEA